MVSCGGVSVLEASLHDGEQPSHFGPFCRCGLAYALHEFVVALGLDSDLFGAGNLIFPPFLGAQAGTASWKAMAGFLVSAACLPILGVAAVAL